MSVKNKQGERNVHMTEYDWFVLNAFPLQDSILHVIVMYPSACLCVVTHSNLINLSSFYIF